MIETALPSLASISRRAAWLIFGAALVFAVARAPQLLLEPRFFAEEGAVYYAVALREPVLDALFHLPPHRIAYLALSATLPATFAAKLMPIELAPFATTYAALAAVLIALALIVFRPSLLWSDPTRKAVACAIVLLAPSSLGEVWLNSTNSQIYFGLISFCILFEDLRQASWRRIALYALLVSFCGLSGVYTSFLSFAFVWKVWLERSRGAWVVASVVAVTSAIQFGAFVWMWSENLTSPAKLQLDWVRSAIFSFHSQFVTPLGMRLFVLDRVDTIRMVYSIEDDARAPAILGTAIASFLAAVAFVVAFVDRDLRSPRSGLVLAFVSLAVMTTLSANFGKTTGRYAVLSGICLLWLLLAHTHRRGGALVHARAVAASALLLWALGVGAAGYRDDPAFTCPGGCPRWTEEVARWRADPTFRPQVWPRRFPPSAPQWRVDLGEP